MNYTSISFYSFLFVVLLFYYLIPTRFRWMVLLGGSITFYFVAYKTGWWILLITILTTYGGGVCIALLRKKYPESLHGLKKPFFVAVVGLTVLPWLCIKNGDFILGSVLHQPTYSWIVPLGISFYTLQMVSYLADVYMGKVQAQTNPAKYALFILFFPQIIQGPIPRYGQLAEKLYKGQLFNETEFIKGFQLILWGFFLKFMIADKSAIIVDEIFGHPDKYVGCYILVAGVLYSIELYTDFLACTVICRGVAELFGIHLQDNFMRPYKAVSVRDFWRRWHISLSSWLRDYIYIPLGGSKKGKLSRYVNLTITFAVSGIWHGAGYKFLFWGLLHAAYQIIGSLTARIRDRIYDVLKLSDQSGVRKILQRTAVFLCVMIAWIIFRADSLTIGFGMVKSMFVVHNPWIFFNDSLFLLGLSWKEWCILIGSIAIMMHVENRQERGERIRDAILTRPLYQRWIIYIAVILCTMIFGTYGIGFNAQDFIYGGF